MQTDFLRFCTGDPSNIDIKINLTDRWSSTMDYLWYWKKDEWKIWKYLSYRFVLYVQDERVQKFFPGEGAEE